MTSARIVLLAGEVRKVKEEMVRSAAGAQCSDDGLCAEGDNSVDSTHRQAIDLLETDP
jgi:hypothetical protein